MRRASQQSPGGRGAHRLPAYSGVCISEGDKNAHKVNYFQQAEMDVSLLASLDVGLNEYKFPAPETGRVSGCPVDNE